MYTIFGGGSIGSRLSRMLAGRGCRVTVVEVDPRRVAGLAAEGVRPIQADIRQVDLGDAIPPGTKAVLVAGGEVAVAEEAVRRVRAHDKDLMVIVISNREGLAPAKAAGADVVLEVPEVLTSTLLREIEDLEARRMSQALLAVLRSSGPKGLAIFCHDNPDADTLASAWAMHHICEFHRVRAVIYYFGVMNMPQSRELVKLLGMKVRQLTAPGQVLEAIAAHGKLALVDSARPGENNSLPPTAVPNIVVDHHSTNMAVRPGEAYDIRGNVGSTSTIMTGHMINLGVPMELKLATALFYGMKTDTQGFTMNVSTADLMAAAYLSAYVYRPLLEMFELPQMPRTTLDALGHALKDRTVRKHLSIAYLGELPDRSALPVTVDLLMQEEGVETAVAFAVVGDTIQLSVRNKAKRMHVGEAVHLAFRGMGSAGGHATSAGGQLEMKALMTGAEGPDAKDKAIERVRTILFDALR